MGIVGVAKSSAVGPISDCSITAPSTKNPLTPSAGMSGMPQTRAFRAKPLYVGYLGFSMA